MAYNENFLFFNDQTAAADATGEGAIYKSSNFLGADVTGAGEVTLYFVARKGNASDDEVVITHSPSNVKLFMQELAAVLSNPKGGLFYQSKFAGEAKGFASNVTNVVVTSAN
jgi:hypothetical protein